jgi:predicted nicotinamide N-methyase
MFGVLWAAGEILARMMQDYDIKGLRILEVGCGLGLSSLLLNQRLADITASDHHPSANELLQYNARLNDGRVIPFFRSSWKDVAHAGGDFDLVIGSDLLYEPNHAALLAGFIDHHAKPCARAIIIDAGRGNVPAFCRSMEGFGFSYTRNRPQADPASPEPFKGHVLLFARA